MAHGLFSQVNSMNKILAMLIAVGLSIVVLRMIPQTRQWVFGS